MAARQRHVRRLSKPLETPQTCSLTIARITETGNFGPWLGVPQWQHDFHQRSSEFVTDVTSVALHRWHTPEQWRSSQDQLCCAGKESASTQCGGHFEFELSFYGRHHFRAFEAGDFRGEFIAYVEVADSGVGFKYTVSHAGTYISGGQAPDLPTAKRMAEKELRILSSGIKN